ncbi:TIGR03089 family protein [Nocardiopsis coralliicola]
MSADTPAELWRAAARAPDRPFVTAYDARTSGRVELSCATFGNWVAKTSHLLLDGLGAAPGDRVAIVLPAHWQTLVWLVSCWNTGVVPVLPGASGAALPEADIEVTHGGRIEAALDGPAQEAVAVSLHPLGAPLPDCPPAALDYADEVRVYPDAFTGPPPAASALALEVASGSLPAASTGAELAAAARERAQKWALTADDRVAILTAAGGADGADTAAASAELPPAALADALLAALVSETPLILTPGIDSDNLQSRLDMEHATALLGASPASLSEALPPPSGDIRPLS